MIDKIKKLVKKKFDIADKENYGRVFFFANHIMPAYHFAMKLAEKYGADKELVGVAVLLHDYGHLSEGGGKRHDRRGSKNIKPILRKLGLAERNISKVSRIVRKHMAWEGDIPITLEEKIVTTSDALSHLLTPWFKIKAGFTKKDKEEYRLWCLKKIEHDYGRIQFKDEKKLAKPSYERIKKYYLR